MEKNEGWNATYIVGTRVMERGMGGWVEAIGNSRIGMALRVSKSLRQCSYHCQGGVLGGLWGK